MADTVEGGALTPPGIGEALGAGWNAYKANLVPVLIGMLCAMLLSIIPVIGGLLAMPGMFNVALKAVRGQKPEPADAFIVFKAGLVDHLIMGLLQICGIILCFIGVWITQPLFIFGTPLILDKGLDWGKAKDVCLARVKPNLIGWIIFMLVIGIVGSLGMVLCFVGIFLTLPIAVCAMAWAYDKTLGGGAKAA